MFYYIFIYLFILHPGFSFPLKFLDLFYMMCMRIVPSSRCTTGMQYPQKSEEGIMFLEYVRATRAHFANFSFILCQYGNTDPFIFLSIHIHPLFLQPLP